MSSELEARILTELMDFASPNLSALQLTEKLDCTFTEALTASRALEARTMRERSSVMVYTERDKNEQVIDFYASVSRTGTQ